MSERDIEKADVSTHDLKQAAISGVRWTTAAGILTEGISLVAAIALARLLTPSQFGQAVVPLIFVPLAVILTFEGFGSALVQRKVINRAHVESAMLASAFTGVALTAVTLLLAGLVGGPLFGSSTAELLRMISPVFLLGGVSAVSRGLLLRRLDFRRISLVEMTSLAFGYVGAVGMAVAGLDAKAIVLGALMASFVTAVLLMASVRPPMPRWHRTPLRQVMGFGLPASAAGLTYVAITNATLVVAAARLAAAQVGLYWRAFQLGVVYQDKISGIMMRLAFPVYSRTSDLNELRRFHERATRIHAAVLLPLLSLLIVTAPDLIPWVFGERWAPAVEPVQVLCVAGMIAGVLTGYPQIMLAAGRPRALFVFNTFLLGLYLLTSWIAAPYGITALALTVVGVHVVMIVAVYALLFRRLLEMPIGRLVTDLLPGVACSVALLAVSFPLADLLRGADAPAPVLVLVVGAIGGLAYMSALRAFFRGVWDDVVQLAVRLLPTDNPGATLRTRRATPRAVGRV